MEQTIVVDPQRLGASAGRLDASEVRVVDRELRGECDLVLNVKRLTVRLSRPLGGRSIVGQTLDSTVAREPGAIVGRRAIARVPRVVGMAPMDALRLLRINRIRAVVRPRGGTRQVIAQHPPAGRSTAGHEPLTLVLGP